MLTKIPHRGISNSKLVLAGMLTCLLMFTCGWHTPDVDGFSDGTCQEGFSQTLTLPQNLSRRLNHTSLSAGLYAWLALLLLPVHGPGLAQAGRQRVQRRAARGGLHLAPCARLRAPAGQHALLLPPLRHRHLHAAGGVP